FGARVLEVMRQPMEDKMVTISRAQGSLTFPANFQLVGAMNPCPCGYYGDAVKACTCSFNTITRYQKRLSGPLLDRIDIHIDVPRVEYEKLKQESMAETSAAVQARVEAGRDIQRERLMDENFNSNADMGPAGIRLHCTLGDEAQALVGSAMKQLQLSARAYHRVLKLGRTIADLAGEENIDQTHIAEALQYRDRINVQ
ncbi:MAG: ATP-binding protein, partial [Anaerolineae bacterium]|nr:ATP-binding protein [Anaerolineae bacterium]